MSDSIDVERERIRAKRRAELQRQLEDNDTAGERTESGAPDKPIQVRDAEHFDEIVQTHPVVLVDCYADWCGPCQMLEPTIDALAAETDAAVAKVDVDEHAHIAQSLGVRGVPTLVMYANGRAAERLVGVQDRDTLANLIDEHLNETT